MSILTVGINQRETKNTAFQKAEYTDMSTIGKNNYVREPKSDVVVIHKRHKTNQGFFTRFIKGVATTLVLVYGAYVLKNRLTKPTLDELQKCFKELLGKDLSQEEFSTLLNKYKRISKEKNSEEYIKRLVAQVKSDYGLGNVDTKLNVGIVQANVKDEVFFSGTATPFGEININRDLLGADIFGNGRNQIFKTTFHELKHLNQYADAYRADADKFTEILVNNTRKIKPEDFEKNAEECIRENKKNGVKVSKNRAMELVIEATKENYRKTLDKLYGKLPKYEKGSPEYQRGIDYMNNYSNYILNIF